MTAEVELMRDGPEGKIIHSIIRSVEVHRMPDGKVKSSPVLVSDEDTQRSARLPSMLRNAGGAAFFRALHEVIRQHGQIIQPDAGMMPISAADQEQVRVRFYELYNDGGAKPDAKKHAFSRTLREAMKAKCIDSRTRDGITWIWIDHSTGED
jgi:hypothetical protein